MLIEVYIDGACEPVNPGGVGTWGYVIYIEEILWDKQYGVVGEGRGISNNVAEYSALIHALEKLIEANITREPVIVYSDSNLLVNQMSGKWAAKGGMYYRYYKKARKLKIFFRNIRFVWIPREKNKEADELTRKAYEEYCKTKGR